MKTNIRLFLLVFIFTLIVFPYAKAQREIPPLKMVKVTESIYEVTGGSGANTGFFIGENQVLVVDAKMSEESANMMINEIKTMTPNPIKTVILTHSDGDHVNGLSGFPKGIDVISHINTRKHMEEAFKEEKLKEYLPNKTFSEKMNLYLGGEKIELIYFYPAHTNGDIVVFFPEQKVAFLGDLIFLNRDPLIHKHKNGNSFGLVKTLKAVLELDADTFVHGHGEIAQRENIQNLITSLEKKQEKIKALIEKGKSLEEVKKEFGIEQSQSRWPSLVEIIYKEITEEK
ncbi:MAG TPA: MBL fold metallo-hydrolase [Acidobacteriota bacterium]|nr:MBL fold metallo-hydrolase [Acidobacteriota bacterium]